MGRLAALGGTLAAGLIVAAPAGGALVARVSVEPARPAALEPATITLRSYAPVVRPDGTCCRLEPHGPRGYPFRVEVVSPAGRVVPVRVRWVGGNRWRGAVTFPTGGRWTVRVANYAQGGYRPAFGSRPRITVRVAARRPTPAPAGLETLGKPGCAPASPSRSRQIFGSTFGGEQPWVMPVLPIGASWAQADRAELDGLTGREAAASAALGRVRFPSSVTGGRTSARGRSR